MKNLYALLLTCFMGSSALAQPAHTFPPRTPLPQLTPVAAKCDLSSCQTRCYVEQSHCNTRNSSDCSTQAQLCVQSCAAQCQ
ncbi:hypothetical protein C7434_1262 [Pantoea sp. PNA 14-12]|nr:hypothetical protein F7Q90_04110 [Pantoea stewartii subsp. stewartii]PXV78109.1 hypothetical protein C7433_101323 [Pantoea sp. PNA 03-3]TDS72447.1 hypothetical protein C7434_1262 [Pantoea sp. PNA 14-12]WHT00696.1 MAG: hypothetical protein LZT29_03774 [Pantoea stewartii]WRH13256.1 hypothetical protein GC087_11770 [Pantoea sp. JZ2]WRH21012.1 hypothetical protein GC090_10175 [Pantoea sp. JZ29]